MPYVALMLQLLAFVARTMLNREHHHYRIVAIHCILLRLPLLSRRSRAREKQAKGRRFWVRAIFRQRQRFGCYHTLVQELRLGDREWHFKFIRISPKRFEHLLRLIAPHISTKKTKLRNPIGPAERLYLTLRYLPSGGFPAVTVISFSYWQGNCIEDNQRNLYFDLALLKPRVLTTSLKW